MSAEVRHIPARDRDETTIQRARRLQDEAKAAALAEADHAIDLVEMEIARLREVKTLRHVPAGVQNEMGLLADFIESKVQIMRQIRGRS